MKQRAIVALVAVALVAVLSALGLTRALERASYDGRMQLRGAHPTKQLAVVAIDEATISGKRQWPLRRSLHARVIDRLREAGVARIVYDVQFTEPSGREADDAALYEAVARAKGMVLATGTSDGHGHTRVLGGDENLRRIGAFAGAANLPAQAGGVIRRYEPEVGGLPAIPTRFAPNKGGLIDYRGPAGTIPTYSFLDVLRGQVPTRDLRGRIVVVGATAPTLQDLHPTPAGGPRLMPGPEIQANAIWTALHGTPLRETAGFIAYVLLALLALAATFRALAAIALGGVYVICAVVAFDHGFVLPVAVPALGAVAAAVATVVMRLTIEIRARQAATRALALTQLDAVDRLARAAELRDDDTGDHIERMSVLCEQVALELGQTAVEARLLRQAATLHDVGKIGLPDSILRKPGRLTDDEVAIMRRHAPEGAALLDGSRSPLLKLAEVIARTHHERWDGSGYPTRLAHEQIPLAGRIAAVCDVYDALTSVRPYKRPWTVAEAVAEITAQRGRHFDPFVADALLRVIERSRPADPGWRADVAQASEAASDSGVPSTAASARSTEVATQVKVGVSRFV